MSDVTSPNETTVEVEQAVLIGQRYCGPKRVVFVVNTDRFFLSHRATWAAALQAAGAVVTVIAEDTGEADVIRRLGVEFVNVRVGRETSSSASAMAVSASRILIALMKIRPKLVFLVHQVAYTLGWPAAVVLRRTTFIRVAGGVGRALDSAALETTSSRVVQVAGRIAGRLSNVFTLFQVEQDRATFTRLGLLPSYERSAVIPGTGIDVDSWTGDTVRDFESPVIVFASRLIREKGIREFVAAAEKMRGRGWRFVVAGDPDPGVTSTVTAAELEQWRANGAVNFLGYRSDMAQVFADATLFVFPSRHPEGTPRVLIEAGASGLPSVVSGQTGCRAVVEHGITGVVLGPEPSVSELADAVERLASDATMASAMGSAARSRVAATYSLDAILPQLLNWEPVGAQSR